MTARCFVGIFCLFFVFAPVVFGHSEDAVDEVDRYAHPEMQSAIDACLSLEEERAACYASLCQHSSLFICAEDILRAVVVGGGPEKGMSVLGEMVASSLFSFSPVNEGHTLAHVVGRMAAQHFGGTGDVFLRCPTSFDYGCQHGFLEDVLPKTSSPSDAVTSICESLPEKPEIGKPNCYHGSGHGVMMNESYNLESALAICDLVPDSLSCWTGVFMENVSGNTNGRIREWYPDHDTFRADNPLAPCDDVAEKYRVACYRQHMPYLAHHFDYDVSAVVEACLSAGEYVPACVFGFGAYSIYDYIQNGFLPSLRGSVVEKTIHFCNQFPEKYRQTCYTPAIDQLSIFYNPEKVSEFCHKVDDQYTRYCFWVVGDRLKNLVVRDDEKIEACASVSEEYRDECLYPDASSFADVGFLVGTTESAMLEFEKMVTQPSEKISWFARFRLSFFDVFGWLVRVL